MYILILIHGNLVDSKGTEIANLSETIEKTTEAKQASSQIGKNVNEIQQESRTEEKNNVIVVQKVQDNKMQSTKSTGSDQVVQGNQTTENEIEEIADLEKENIQEKKDVDPIFSMPVEGEVIKEYAKDSLVYSETLKEWITHSGIDIKAEKTTIIKASETGIVKSIKNDPRYGLTVVIEHTSGYSTVYSNLLTAEFVVVGEKVEKGQTIGTVGNTATFEIADEPHLHFEILKDNVQLDPNMYIK